MSNKNGQDHADGSAATPCSVSRNYHGKPVEESETPETQIHVWEIEPSLDTGYDYAVIRCYQDAVEYAKRVVEDVMDDPERQYPTSVIIRQSSMSLADYDELQE
jgi:hypothetical protein